MIATNQQILKTLDYFIQMKTNQIVLLLHEEIHEAYHTKEYKFSYNEKLENALSGIEIYDKMKKKYSNG